VESSRFDCWAAIFGTNAFWSPIPANQETIPLCALLPPAARRLCLAALKDLRQEQSKQQQLIKISKAERGTAED
jgi:hypothetical protein